MLVNANSSRERPVLLNRPSKNEMSSSASSKNRRRLKSRRDALKRKRRRSLRSTLNSSVPRFTPTTRNPSRIGSTTSRRGARSAKRLTMSVARLRLLNRRSLTSWTHSTSPRSTLPSWPRKRSLFEDGDHYNNGGRKTRPYYLLMSLVRVNLRLF